MIKLLIVGNQGERCGNSVFTDNLIKSLAQFPVEIKVVRLAEDTSTINTDFDILQFNFIPGMEVDDSWFRVLPKVPKKIYNLHVTQPFNNRNPFTDLFNAVVVHHEFVKDEAPNFAYIPHGILEVEGDPPKSPDLVIGSAGFPQTFKGLDAICYAALEIGDCELMLIMPESKWADAIAAGKVLKELVVGKVPINIIHDWLTDVEVVNKLREYCSVAAFSHLPNAPGVGGAVRMAIAAKIPIVVPDIWHFRDIREFAYLADFSSPTKLADTIIKAHKERKDCWTVPIETMGWSKVGKMYFDLYSRIMNE